MKTSAHSNNTLPTYQHYLGFGHRLCTLLDAIDVKRGSLLAIVASYGQYRRLDRSWAHRLLLRHRQLPKTAPHADWRTIRSHICDVVLHRQFYAVSGLS